MGASRFLLLGLILSGCVTQARYEAVEGKLAASSLSYEQMLRERDGQLEAKGDRLQELETAHATLAEQFESTDTRLEECRATNARILNDQGDLQTELESLEAGMRDLEEQKAHAAARLASYQELIDRFQSLVDAGTLEVRLVDGRMVVTMATDSLFASGSADLSSEGRASLTEVGQVLSQMDRAFQVEGHTDDVPIQTERFPSNWYLAAARAIGVVEHLVDAGVSEHHLSAASYGEMRPVASNDHDEGRQANRRIEIVLVPDLDALPGHEALEALEQGTSDAP